MAIIFHPHALERMAERGASENEVVSVIRHGNHFPAKFGRVGFRGEYSFKMRWKGKFYSTKQLEVYAVEQGKDLIVITVVVKYY